MKRLLLLATGTFSALILSAQINVQWETRYTAAGANNDIPVEMYVDGAGNVYVTGSSYTAASGYNIVTRKYNNAGVVQWTSTYNGAGNGIDEARGIAVDGSGNVYVTGYTFVGGTNFDMITVKYNSGGTQQWALTNDGAGFYDESRDIVVDNAGDIIVVGGIQATSTNTNYRTIKYTAAGAVAWSQDYSSGANLDMALAVTVDAANSVFVTGHAFNTGQDLNIRTIKYNSAGTQQWNTQVNYSIINSLDTPTSIAVDASGNTFVTGRTYNGATTEDDIVTIKYNNAGTIVANTLENGTANSIDKANKLKIDASGNVYVAGKLKNFGSAEDFYVVKYDNSLNEQWAYSYNGQGGNYDEAYDLSFDGSGEIYATGYSYLSSSNNDFLTVRLKLTDGSQSWETRFNGTANNSDQAKSMAVDAIGNVYVTGESKGSGTGTDYSTIKYCQLTTNAGPDTSICSGTSVQLIITGGPTVVWQPTATLSCLNCANPVATPSADETYIVSTTDGNGCTDYDTVSVTINPLPGPVITASGPTSFCIGDSVTLTASGFSSYSWSTGDTTASITVNTAGNYGVTVTDAMGCNNSTNQVITVFSLPNIDAGSADPFCEGDSTQLSASGGVSYVWDPSPDLSNLTVSNPFASPTATSTYYVTGTDGNGCENIDSVTVVVYPLPSQPTNTYIITPPTVVTNNATGNQWYLNGVPISGATGQTHSVVANGDYWVVYTDANGCASMNSDTVTVTGIGVGEIENKYHFSVYPNPNNGNFTLNLSLTQSENIKIEMLDVIGKVIVTESYSASGIFRKSFSADHLPKGIYMVRVNIGNDTITKRVIIH